MTSFRLLHVTLGQIIMYIASKKEREYIAMFVQKWVFLLQMYLIRKKMYYLIRHYPFLFI